MNFHKVARALVPGVRHQALHLWFTEDEIPEAYQKDVDEKGLFGLLPNLESLKIGYLAPFSKYWESICRLPKLKKLEIAFSADDLVHLKDLGRIKSLTSLILRVCEEPKSDTAGYLEHIWQLPNLRTLSLSGFVPDACVDSVHLLPNLKHFKLSESETIQHLPANLSQCAGIETLTFEYLHYIPQIPDTYRHFQHLNTLIMRNIKLEIVPEWLSELPNLKSLNLYDNNFPLVPAKVLFCPHLEELRVGYSQTPFADEQAMQKFVFFLKNPSPFWAKNPMELVDILYGKVENVATKPNVWFLELINARLSPIPRQAVDWLEQKYTLLPQNMKDLGTNTHLSVLSLAGLEKSALQERLKAVGISHNFGKVLPKTTHALIGSTCKFDLAQAGIDWEKIIFIQTAHLFEILNRKEGAFLTHAEVLPEQSELDNLAQLINLDNLDLSCLEIAYQLLDKGGIPPALLVRVVVFCLLTTPRGKFGEMHQKMKKLALRHLPNAFKTLLNRSSIFSSYKSNDFYINQLRLFLEAGKDVLSPFELILSHAKITNCLAAGSELLEAPIYIDFLKKMDAYQLQKNRKYPTYKLQLFNTSSNNINTAKAYEMLEILAKVPMRVYEHSTTKLNAESSATFWEKISLSADSLEILNIYYEIAFPTAAIPLNRLKILDLNQNLAATLPDWVWELPSLEYIVFPNQTTPLAIATTNGFELKQSPADDKFSLYVGSPLEWWVGENIYYFQKCCLSSRFNPANAHLL